MRFKTVRITLIKFSFLSTILSVFSSCSTYVNNEHITNIEENYKSYDTSNYKRSYIKSTETETDNPNRNKVPIIKSYIEHDESKIVINDPETIEDFTNIQIDLMDKATNLCADLGFKKGTEKFGECVLKLSE